jgi:hypothetical protein
MTRWFSSIRFEEKLLLALSVGAIVAVYLMIANDWWWSTRG